MLTAEMRAAELNCIKADVSSFREVVIHSAHKQISGEIPLRQPHLVEALRNSNSKWAFGLIVIPGSNSSRFPE